jgi:catechol 2,3-dioxygenase
MLDRGVEPVAAHEHGVSQSVYFKDLDGNGLELYYEYPPEQWPPEDERFRRRPLDLGALLALAGQR